MSIKTVKDDCLNYLKTETENTYDALITDPPAGISFMGKDWDHGANFIERMREIYKECLRVMKPGAHGLVWALPRTSHWTATALETAGFEIRDCITHLFGTGFPKSLNLGEGRGTALKPAAEFWWLIRKPISEKTVAKNVERWGCGGINIDECRIGTTVESWPPSRSYAKGHMPLSGHVKAETQKTNLSPPGRFPANLVLDEQAAAMLDEQSGDRPNSFRKNSSAGKPQEAQFKGIGNRGPILHNNTGGASRFFYVAKASKAERNAGLGDKNETALKHGSRPCDWEQQDWSKVNANHHPTVKSLALMKYLIKLITPPNGTILDPFMGSGSTGVAAKQLGFHFVGIEKEEEYFKIAEARIEY